MNFDAEAKRIANYIHSQPCEPHRGVAPLKEAGVSVAFGNDDYSHDVQTREEVRLLIQDAYEASIDVVGFAVDDDGGSCWALVLRCDDLDWIKARLHDAFFQSHGLYRSDQSLVRESYLPSNADAL